MNEEKSLSRRETMKIAIWTIAGLIGSALGIPAIAYIAGPALQQDEDQGWVKLGPAGKVELGMPTLFKVKIIRQAGWVSTEEQVGVFVLTENGREYIAMSNICTHLGCRVRWLQDQEQFLSPCHFGIFDKQGMVVSGPPPRPLDRYEVNLKDGQIYIGKLYRVEI